VKSRVAPSAALESAIEELLSQGLGDGEQLAEIGRLGARLVLQRAIEEEVATFLNRPRYERTAEARGSRNGVRPRRVQTAEGELEVKVPQLRNTVEQFVSRVIPETRTVIRTRLFEWYWRGYQTTNPSLLQPAVSAHVAQLWPLPDESLPEATGRRLRSLVAQAAALGGWLCLRLTNRSATAMYWSLAEALAIEAEDATLRRFALGCRSSLYSSTLRGGHGGDTILALALLDAAAGSEVPSMQRAWTLARSAEEHAVSGDGDEAQRDLDAAGRYLSQVQHKDGYFAAWDAGQLAGYRGSCAQALGWGEAIPLLEGSLAASAPSLISQRIAILTNLGAAHAQHEQVDAACAALTEALTIAGRTNLAVSIQRVRGVRAGLERWSAAPAVRHLDELIGSLA
jgi:hypothetical protein